MFSLNIIKEKIKEYTKDPQILKRIDKVAFFISLVPITGVREIAELISKVTEDKLFTIQIDKIFNEISSINKNLDLSNVITREQAQEIKNTLKVVTALQDKLDVLIKDVIKKVQKESNCSIITQDWSLQKVLNSTFEEDNYSVTTEDHSETVLDKVSIKAKQSIFKATKHSKNILESVNCCGNSGGVGFKGITQEGKIKTKEASIEMESGAFLTFRKKGLKK